MWTQPRLCHASAIHRAGQTRWDVNALRAQPAFACPSRCAGPAFKPARPASAADALGPTLTASAAATRSLARHPHLRAVRGLRFRRRGIVKQQLPAQGRLGLATVLARDQIPALATQLFARGAPIWSATATLCRQLAVCVAVHRAQQALHTVFMHKI